jgi:uncharacterized protein
MSQIRVQQLFIHPIKGLSPHPVQNFDLKIGHGIPGDRAFALMYKQHSDPNPLEVPWMKKHNFAMRNLSAWVSNP